MITFQTKAETLRLLEKQVTKSKALPQVSFTVGELQREEGRIGRELEAFACGRPMIVRSSSLSEDSGEESKAGKYLSIPHVQGAGALLEASKKVASSFEDGEEANIVFVQPMLDKILLSGVVFTADPNTLGNYYVINYDTSGSTCSVTSGEGRSLQTYYRFKDIQELPAPETLEQKRLHMVVEAVKELETLFDNPAMDVEFAVDEEDQVYILQARPLILKGSLAQWQEQKEILGRIQNKLAENFQPKPYLYGRRTIYGVMPDWNPAEIIGVRPRPLTMSLYKRLVTDGTWAYQRSNYGYRNLRSFPLMLDFGGLPYIDTRVSFNSFIPRDIDEELSAKLADYYLDSLERNPDKHDKVEFDIIFSCYTFDLPERIQILGKHGFSQEEQEELKNSLLSLTNHIINPKDGLWLSDSQRIQILEERREQVLKSKLDLVSKIYWLLEDCTRYGTLPFAGLARAGFIAVLLLQSLVHIGILEESDYHRYMGELNTVSSQMARDRTQLSWSAFLEKYGHLRPGTYDILSPRYDAEPEGYFGAEASFHQANQTSKEKPEPFTLTLQQYQKIQEEMEQQGFEGDVLSLFQFIKAGIEGRESSKFIFTKSLSAALELMAELGKSYGFTREDMSYVDISVINRLYVSSADPRGVLEAAVQQGKKCHATALGLTLPPVLMHPQQAVEFFLPTGSPNYITLRSVTGKTIGGELAGKDLTGKILLISAADPGYDWIFSHPIGGFITAYGGANSHMAIRAGELGIPAVIGVGEKLFALYQSANTLQLDCANKKVEILR